MACLCEHPVNSVHWSMASCDGSDMVATYPACYIQLDDASETHGCSLALLASIKPQRLSDGWLLAYGRPTAVGRFNSAPYLS